MKPRCLRCKGTITDKSAFASVLHFRNEKVKSEIIRVVNLKVDTPAIHLNGDRECLRELTGFPDRVRKALGISQEIVLGSFKPS